MSVDDVRVNPWILVHMAATWAMVGFIWTIQVLHYPLMAKVPAAAFPAYVDSHQKRVVAVLAVFAVVEVVSAAAIGFVTDAVPTWLWLGSGALLVVIWVATGAFYAPLHGRLADGWDSGLHDQLVRTNWFRTIGWSIRGVAAGAMVVAATN